MDFEKEQLISITDVAADKFKTMLLDASGQDLFLRLSLELEGSQMYYNIDTVETAFAGDKAYDFNGLKVLINEDDELLLKGLVIDYITDEHGENFVMDNPNMISVEEEDGGCCGRGCCC